MLLGKRRDWWIIISVHMERLSGLGVGDVKRDLQQDRQQ